MSRSLPLADLISLASGYARDGDAITVEEAETLERLAETLDEIECYGQEDLEYLRKLEEYPDCDEGDWLDD